MLIFLLSSLIAYVAWDIGYKQKRVKYAASLCVSIGIFGTFLGIATALYDMDTTGDIKNTISHFVGALRLSFLTSVFGIGANILLRISVSEAESKDDSAMYYIQFLEKLYRRVDDIHTIAMPNSANYITPPHQLQVIEKLDALNDTLLHLTNPLPPIPILTESQKVNGKSQAMSANYFQNLNQLIEDNLSNSFEKLRRDIGVISNNLSTYPQALHEFTGALETVSVQVMNYNQNLVELDEQLLTQTSGVTQLTAAMERLNQQTTPIKLTQESLETFLVTMNEVIHNVDNREAAKDLRFLRKQYTSELKEELGAIKGTLAHLGKIINLSITTSKNKNEYV